MATILVHQHRSCSRQWKKFVDLMGTCSVEQKDLVCRRCCIWRQRWAHHDHVWNHTSDDKIANPRSFIRQVRDDSPILRPPQPSQCAPPDRASFTSSARASHIRFRFEITISTGECSPRLWPSAPSSPVRPSSLLQGDWPRHAPRRHLHQFPHGALIVSSSGQSSEGGSVV